VSFARYAVDRQEGDAGSTLELYRAALRLRRQRDLGNGELVWRDAEPGVVAFANGGVHVVVNTNDHPVALPGGEVLVSSVPLDSGHMLPANSAVWLG
jgi:alpha-glucosidase